MKLSTKLRRYALASGEESTAAIVAWGWHNMSASALFRSFGLIVSLPFPDKFGRPQNQSPVPHWGTRPCVSCRGRINFVDP